MNHLTSLEDAETIPISIDRQPVSSSSTPFVPPAPASKPVAIGGVLPKPQPAATTSEVSAPTIMSSEPMKTDVFTPLPGEKKPCCKEGGSSRGTVVNVNVNAGNNNGNNNGAAIGGGGDTPRNKTYVDNSGGFDSPSGARPQQQTRIVEKPVYKPMVMIREKIRKLLQYQPQNTVYERRVGRSYDDRPMSFEGKATEQPVRVVKTNEQAPTATIAPAATNASTATTAPTTSNPIQSASKSG